MKESTLNLGVVGCGDIFLGIYAPILLARSGRARIAALCDQRKSSALQAAKTVGPVPVYTEVGAMLEQENLDAVFVLTSEKASAAVARQILSAGLPVYLEKPPAIDQAQFEELLAAEARSKARVYPAFNRRHTPLFSDGPFLHASIRRVSGALVRTDREAATFPYTAVHLLDSAQHFARSPFRDWKIIFERSGRGPCWTVDGTLESGASCHLEMLPDAGSFQEFLVLKTEEKSWELQFPNRLAAVPEGEIIARQPGREPVVNRPGNKVSDFNAATGFCAGVDDFFSQLTNNRASSPHPLEACRSTIRIMDEMVRGID